MPPALMIVSGQCAAQETTAISGGSVVTPTLATEARPGQHAQSKPPTMPVTLDQLAARPRQSQSPIQRGNSKRNTTTEAAKSFSSKSF